MTEEYAPELKGEAADKASKDFMAALRYVQQKSGRTAGQVAAFGNLPRSTAYRFVDPRNTTLPKYRHQLASFLHGCRLLPSAADVILQRWDNLTGNSSDPAPDEDSEFLFPIVVPMPGATEAPDLVVREANRPHFTRIAHVKMSHDRREAVAKTSLSTTGFSTSDVNSRRGLGEPRRAAQDGVRARSDGLWVATADGGWVRADQIVRVKCDRNKVMLHLDMPSADGVREDYCRMVVRCRSAVAARKTASDIVYALVKHANSTGTMRIDSTGQLVVQSFTTRGITTRAG
ncbi:hypothetical protein [Nocardia nova]|uniref:hypothetical protein n=1 Tax=Nocardia nova TaxID=37330 RepID=UPI00189498B3|nr:hypothetical protein [Nocardia nova]MBF6150290.1 hypothetical protein [Nocardia nova]